MMVIKVTLHHIQMYGSGSTQALLPYICLLFPGFSNIYHFACVRRTALKLGCITNFNMLFLVMTFNLC